MVIFKLGMFSSVIMQFKKGKNKTQTGSLGLKVTLLLGITGCLILIQLADSIGVDFGAAQHVENYRSFILM